MQRGILVVFADPSNPDREDEFNEWYDGTHLAEVLRVPGFVAATRYRRLMSDTTANRGPQTDYLAVYELEGEDLDAIADALHRAAPDMDISDVLRREPRPITMLFREISGHRPG